MLKKFLFTVWFVAFLFITIFCIKNGSFNKFIEFSENKTFDIRQGVLISQNVRKHNPNIVIVAIDDASYEYIMDKYGEWPLKRDIYAKLVDYIELQKPKSIAFDLLFVKSMKSDIQADKMLGNVFEKYNNVFTSMNLDDQESDVREPVKLPDKLSYNIENFNYDVMEYSNCRTIISEILNKTSNIGMINVARSDDGILRKMPLFLKYQNKLYPQLAFVVGSKYLSENTPLNYKTNNFGQLTFESKISPSPRYIQPDKDGSVILNWYGPAGTFENIPLYKILKEIDGTEKTSYDFKDKIVYIGATASSLYDIKSVPVDKVYPGVEVQTTYVNNLIDGTFISHCTDFTNILLGILLSILTIICVFRINSMPLAFVSSISIYTIYILGTYYAMYYYNMWVKIVSPITFAIFSFIVAVIIKYIIKSRDFDQQYKLATIDGLTELYNHRYFQEQLKLQINNSQRYSTELSLIIIDIDKFKNFNDTYGHQSGDAVLKQVASTLKKNVRQTDIVCRYGGEEMSIILPNTSYEEGVNLANKLCKLVADKKCKLSNGKESNVTISLGVSSLANDGDTPTDIIEAADKRLYQAKNNGRNRVN